MSAHFSSTCQWPFYCWEEHGGKATDISKAAIMWWSERLSKKIAQVKGKRFVSKVEGHVEAL